MISLARRNILTIGDMEDFRFQDGDAGIKQEPTTGEDSHAVDPGDGPAHVIVVGNEKGGSGKSTTSVHIIVALLRESYKIASIDLDARQWTLSRYLSNRKKTSEKGGLDLPMPTHVYMEPSTATDKTVADAEDAEKFKNVLGKLRAEHDFVLIDCPGTDRYLARLAHTYADTLVTPLNDSFIDLDLLGRVDGETGRVLKPSIYAEMIWDQRKERAKQGKAPIDWVVFRNRLSNLDARNKRLMADALTELSKRIGFRLIPNLSERVVYRELFTKGLTLLDLFEMGHKSSKKMAHVAARQELRAMVNSLQLPLPERLAKDV